MKQDDGSAFCAQILLEITNAYEIPSKVINSLQTTLAIKSNRLMKTVE